MTSQHAFFSHRAARSLRKQRPLVHDVQYGDEDILVPAFVRLRLELSEIFMKLWIRRRPLLGAL